MSAERVTRREFVRDTAIGAAALAAGVSTVKVGNAEDADTTKIVNYNPDMEYRRCGKTELMVSAVCMGGHWKRMDKVIPGLFQTERWLSAKLNDKDFEQNRYDVVTRLIERGISITRRHDGQGRVRTTGPSPRLSRTPVRPGAPASAPGADGAAVINEIGLGAERAGLVDSRVLVEAL